MQEEHLAVQPELFLHTNAREHMRELAARVAKKDRNSTQRLRDRQTDDHPVVVRLSVPLSPVSDSNKRFLFVGIVGVFTTTDAESTAADNQLHT